MLKNPHACVANHRCNLLLFCPNLTHENTYLLCISTVSHLSHPVRTVCCNHAETDRNHHRFSDLGVATAGEQTSLHIWGADLQRLLFCIWDGFKCTQNNHWSSLWEQLQLHCHHTDRRWHWGSSWDSVLLYTYVYIQVLSVSVGFILRGVLLIW